MNSVFIFSNYFLFIILSVCYCWPVLLTLFKWHSCSILSTLQLYTRCFNENFWPIHSIRYSKNSFSLNSIELIWFGFALLWFALLIFLDIFVLLLYYRCYCSGRCWYFFVIFFFNLCFLVRCLCSLPVFSCYVDWFKSVQFSLVRSRFSKDIKIYAIVSESTSKFKHQLF